MNQPKNNHCVTDIIDTEQKNIAANTKDDTRRDFIKKFGKLALVTPIGVTALMTPKTSKAMSSDTGPF